MSGVEVVEAGFSVHILGKDMQPNLTGFQCRGLSFEPDSASLGSLQNLIDAESQLPLTSGRTTM